MTFGWQIDLSPLDHPDHHLSTHNLRSPNLQSAATWLNLIPGSNDHLYNGQLLSSVTTINYCPLVSADFSHVYNATVQKRCVQCHGAIKSIVIMQRLSVQWFTLRKSSEHKQQWKSTKLCELCSASVAGNWFYCLTSWLTMGVCKIMQVQVISAITNCKIMVICQNKHCTIVGTNAWCANMWLYQGSCSKHRGANVFQSISNVIPG